MALRMVRAGVPVRQGSHPSTVADGALSRMTLLTVLISRASPRSMPAIRAPTLTPDEIDAAADELRRLAAAARAEHRSVQTTHVIEVIQPVTLPTAWLTSSAAADILGVSRNTAKKWARTGYLRGSRRDPEGWWRIPRSSVERVAQVESDLTTLSGPGDDLPWRS